MSATFARQTGSLTNQLYANATINAPTPKLGDGATILSYTDRHAATVVDVFVQGSTLFVTVQRDRATRTDANGMSDCQSYEYARDPEGTKSTFRKSADGRWQHVWLNHDTKRWNKTDGYGLIVGKRDHHYDFSF